MPKQCAILPNEYVDELCYNRAEVLRPWRNASKICFADDGILNLKHWKLVTEHLDSTRLPTKLLLWVKLHFWGDELPSGISSKTFQFQSELIVLGGTCFGTPFGMWTEPKLRSLDMFWLFGPTNCNHFIPQVWRFAWTAFENATSLSGASGFSVLWAMKQHDVRWMKFLHVYCSS